MSIKITRDDMMDALNISDKPLSDKYIKLLYNEFVINPNKKSNKNVTKKIPSLIDTTTNKYKILLLFINKILLNIDKEPITNLTQFKNINREDIILPKNIPILEDLAPELFKQYNKKQSGYYRKSKNIVHCVIRNLVKELGMSYCSEKKNIHTREKKRSYVKTQSYYTIKNI